MRCFSCMLISNVYKSIIVMNSIDTRFSRNVLEAVQKTRSACFIGSKATRLRLVVLNPLKHSCSFLSHYLMCLTCFNEMQGVAPRMCLIVPFCAISLALERSFRFLYFCFVLVPILMFPIKLINKRNKIK